mmetsp:Transcript_141022/g.351713  ORF Transcript_141022/g.351713 Transcript_141022/m.351713 type:complete len:233 (-) Transcript_141022:244-942(-)
MASNQQPAVVVGTVVQPTAVGQPVGAPLPTYGYDPNAAQRQADSQNAGMGWIIYAVGWFVCCCCGPCGPIFWFAVGCMHFCKPKEQRDRLPQEKVVAQVSICTGVCCTIVTVLAIIAYIALAVAVGDLIENYPKFCSTSCSNGWTRYDEIACYTNATAVCSTATYVGEEAQCDWGEYACTTTPTCPTTCKTYDTGVSRFGVLCLDQWNDDHCSSLSISGTCEASATRCYGRR